MLLRAGVDPVQVLEHENDGADGGAPQRQPPHRLEDPLPPGGRVHRGDGWIARVHGEQVAHVWDVRVDLPHPAHGVLDLGDDLGLPVELLDAEVLPELVDERQERDGLAEGDALAFEPGHRLARLGQPAAEFQQEARLSDAGIARDEYHLPPTGLGRGEALDQSGDFVCPPHEPRQPALHRGAEARAPEPRAQRLPGPHRCVPLDLDLAQIERLKECRHQPMGRVAQHDAGGSGDLLHPRGKIGGVPHRRVVHPKIVADASNDDRSRIDPDSHLEPRPALGLQLLAVIPERALDAECRVHGAPRPVLVGDGSPEQRHDAVSRVLIDCSFEAVDLGRDQLEASVHDAVDVLGVELLGQGRKARHVAEEHGHLAALALERGAAGQDLLG